MIRIIRDCMIVFLFLSELLIYLWSRNLSLNSSSLPSKYPLLVPPLIKNWSVALHIPFDDTPVHENRPLIPIVTKQAPEHSFFPHFLRVPSFFSKPSTTLPPLLTVITITRNPPPYFLDTAKSIQRQSLRRLQWLIVNDHTYNTSAYRTLSLAVSRTTRYFPTFMHNSSDPPGFIHGRLRALDILHTLPRTPYVAFLDDDDLLESTFYEKCVLALNASPHTAVACGSYVIGFGARNYTWTYGFHSGIKHAVRDNPMTGREVLRSSIFLYGNKSEHSCTFNKELRHGLEDWDLYLCLASNGLWGITVPEYLTWYRRNPFSQRQKRWPDLFNPDAVEEVRKRWDIDFHAHDHLLRNDTIGLNRNEESIKNKAEHLKKQHVIPFENPIEYDNENGLGRVLLVFPSIRADRTGRHYVSLTAELVTSGYQVSVVTFLRGCNGAKLLRHSTSDVLSLSSLARTDDMLSLLNYAISSRRPTLIALVHVPVIPTFSNSIHASLVHVQMPNRIRREVARESMSDMYSSRGDVVVTVVEHGGWMGYDGLEVLLHALAECSRIVSKESRQRKVRFIVTGVGAGVEVQLRRAVSMLNGKTFVIIPKANDETLRQVDSAADVICAVTRPGKFAVASTESLQIGLLHAGILRVGDETEGMSIISKDGKKVKAWNVREITEVILQYTREAINQRERDERWELKRGDDDDKEEKLFVESVKNRIENSLQQEIQPDSLKFEDREVWARARRLMGIDGTQRWLEGHSRGKFGEEYRTKCGEYNAEHRMLVDYMESSVPCNDEQYSLGDKESKKLEVENMQKNALEQCGRWCIMDLADKKRQRGWAVREACGIESFDNANHKCSIWYKKVSKKWHG